MCSNHRRRSKLVRARRLRPLSSSMHRMVLGAYQRCALGPGASRGSGLNAPSGAGCLPTSPTPTPDPSPKRLNTPCGAGCLSTAEAVRAMLARMLCLNTPCGAGCLSTTPPYLLTGSGSTSQYTVWCWVLIDSAYRKRCRTPNESQYTVWCWVLIDSCPLPPSSLARESQYTVWCWVLIDLTFTDRDFSVAVGLNTPCGAGCLSTICQRGKASKTRRLNTPCGAGCLSTQDDFAASGGDDWVSIHRVVLGAYRRRVPRLAPAGRAGLNTPCGAGCLSTRDRVVHSD